MQQCMGLYGVVRGCTGLYGVVRGCMGLYGVVKPLSICSYANNQSLFW